MTRSLTVRPYELEDESSVLELLQTSLGGSPVGAWTSEFFTWKHRDNPFGSSFLLLCEDAGTLVGLRAFMRWEFHAGGRLVRAVRAVDTATHPDHQRRGIFSLITREGIAHLADEVDLIFNTPNEKSLPGYLKLGWRSVDKLLLSIRARRPFRLVAAAMGHAVPTRAGTARAPSRDSEQPPMSDREALDSLLSRISSEDDRLTTSRTADYLLWRYVRCPGIAYRTIVESNGSDLAGILVYRIRDRRGLTEASITELLVKDNDVAVARRLLSRMLGEVSTDHAACHFPPGSPPGRAARRALFLPMGLGTRLVVNTLGHELDPDPTLGGSWALSLGDLELF